MKKNADTEKVEEETSKTRETNKEKRKRKKKLKNVETLKLPTLHQNILYKENNKEEWTKAKVIGVFKKSSIHRDFRQLELEDGSKIERDFRKDIKDWKDKNKKLDDLEDEEEENELNEIVDDNVDKTYQVR